MRRRALTHHQRGDVRFLARNRGLLRTRKRCRILPFEKSRADLEQANIALHASEVVLGARNESRHQVAAQKRFVLRQRIGDANSCALSLRHERHRPDFVETGSDERFLHAFRDSDERRIGHGAGPERSQLRGERVVAPKARDLFGQIHVAMYIVPPARR